MTNPKENRKVPELRFPEFSEEWEAKKLGEIAEFKNGINKDKSDFGTGIPFVNLMDVFGKNIISNDNFSLIKANKNEIENYSLRKGDVLFIRSSVKRSGVGQTVIVKESLTNTIYSGFLIRMRDKYNILAENYKRYYFYNNSFRKQILKKSTSSANTNINQEELSKLIIKFPSFTEQQKIGDFFSKLDRQIELEEKKLALLEEQKKGYMQKIFSQELRFKDENGEEYPEWEKKLIKNIAKTYSGGTPDSKNSNYYNGNIPFIRSGEINKYITELNVNELAIRSSSARLVEKGDILYALYGATSGEVSISKINGAINQAVLCIKTNQDNFYVYSFLVNNKVSIVNRYIQGGQGNLSANIINNLIIQLPIKTEQIKISGLLSTLDNKIECSKRKIVIRKKLKLAYLGKIFI